MNPPALFKINKQLIMSYDHQLRGGVHSGKKVFREFAECRLSAQKQLSAIMRCFSYDTSEAPFSETDNIARGLTETGGGGAYTPEQGRAVGERTLRKNALFAVQVFGDPSTPSRQSLPRCIGSGYRWCSHGPQRRDAPVATARLRVQKKAPEQRPTANRPGRFVRLLQRAFIAVEMHPFAYFTPTGISESQTSGTFLSHCTLS